MEYPAALNFSTIEEYRQHYEEEYCQNPVITFDGIPVYFKKIGSMMPFLKAVKEMGSKTNFRKYVPKE
jgi:hypothetical protein